MIFTKNNQRKYSGIWGGGRLLPIFFLCFSCAKKETYLFLEKDARACGIQFVNAVTSDERHNFINYSYAYNGGGTGAADLDNDGLPELVFTGNQVPCALYRNRGNLQFEDMTAASGLKTEGWCTGVTFADINADGLLDVYISRAGNYDAPQRANLCFINQGNLQFKEQAAELGLADTGWSTQAAFFDADRDGDLDCYVLNATNTDRYPNRIKKDRKFDGSDPASDQFYRNNNGHFEPATVAAGLGDDAWGLGLSIADFNGDLWPDIYVANDFLANDILYINQKNGQFRNLADSLLGHTSHFSMGCDAADYNNDGRTDLFVADMMPSTNLQRKKMTGVLSAQAYQMVLESGYAPQYMRNTLQLNTGQGFAEIGQMAGVFSTDWTWSPLFADFDLDGKQDLVMTTGYLHDIIDMDFILQNNELGRTGMNLQEIDKIIKERAAKQTPYASAIRFFQQNNTWSFTDQTGIWNSQKDGFHNGSVAVDLDGDGDLDVVSNNINQSPDILVNTAKNQEKTPKNTLTVQLSAPQPIGSLVRVHTGATVQTRYLSYTHGYQSAGDGRLYFGLDSNAVADKVEVIWPDGQYQTLEKAVGLVVIRKTPGSMATPEGAALTAPLLQKTGETKWKHAETPYNDFDIEPLLPRQFSREGPGVAVGDANGDGLDDIFVTGAKGQLGTLMLQTPGGAFTETTIGTLPKFEEDVAALFTDVDNDKDLDLVVISGGIELEPDALRYSPRLYLNDGKAVFTPTEGYLPVSRQPGGCVTAGDYDGDGDQDLFIGGRRTSLKYGVPGKSMLLQNDGTGHFTDVTERIAPGLSAAGMLTDAIWADWNGDGQLDLLVAGEWMPLTLFAQNNGAFRPNALSGTRGFWYCLEAGDLDGDGDLDVVAGNMGKNNKYGISAKTPVQLFSKDFDGNGYFDPVMAYFIQNQLVTVHGRDELMRQLPKLRKQFNSYKAYGSASLEQVFPAKDRADALALTMEECRSAVFYNDGKGGFTPCFLPDEMQTAPMRDVLISDVDGNGTPNIIAIGNDYAWESGSGRMDASAGWILDTKDHFNWAAMPGGAFAKGDGRALKLIRHPNIHYLIAKNNDNLLFFSKSSIIQ